MRQLPSHNECADKLDENEASSLEIFIHNNEPAGIEESKLFRWELANMLNAAVKECAHELWDGGRLQFAKEIGNDMSEEEEYGPIPDSPEQCIEKYMYEPVTK